MSSSYGRSSWDSSRRLVRIVEKLVKSPWKTRILKCMRGRSNAISSNGRKMSYDRAVEVWGVSGVSRKIGKVSLCKTCYRSWKKEKKDEPKEWVSKSTGPLGNAPNSIPVRSFDQP
jgi:hypothetical protein